MEEDNQFVKQFTMFDNGFDVIALNPYPQIDEDRGKLAYKKSKSLYVKNRAISITNSGIS